MIIVDMIVVIGIISIVRMAILKLISPLIRLLVIFAG